MKVNDVFVLYIIDIASANKTGKAGDGLYFQKWGLAYHLDLVIFICYPPNQEKIAQVTDN